MHSFVVGLIDRSVRIIVLLTKNSRLVIKRLREIDFTAAFIGFRETVVDVSRVWITFDIRLEDGNRFFRIRVVAEEQLVTDLIDQCFRYRDLVSESLAEFCIVSISAFQAANDRSALEISRTLPAGIDFSQTGVVTAKHHRSVVFIIHALGLPLKPFDTRLREQFPETVKALTDRAGLVTE